MKDEPLIKRGLRKFELRKWELREGRMTITLNASAVSGIAPGPPARRKRGRRSVSEDQLPGLSDGSQPPTLDGSLPLKPKFSKFRCAWVESGSS